MEFLKIVKIRDVEYHIYYDENIKAVNFFIYINNTGETECLSLLYENIEPCYKGLTEYEFKKDYDDILFDIMSREYKVQNALINYQIFEKGFWEDLVLRKFKDCEMRFLKIHKCN